MKKKLLSVLLTSLLTILVLPIGANAEWKSDSHGWWYAEGNSWATGWRELNNKWYYFDDTGYMMHDAIIKGYRLGSDGAWIQKNNYSYNECLEIAEAFFSNSHMNGYKFTTKSNGILNSSNQYYFEFYSTNNQKVDWCYVNVQTGKVNN